MTWKGLHPTDHTRHGLLDPVPRELRVLRDFMAWQWAHPPSPAEFQPRQPGKEKIFARHSPRYNEVFRWVWTVCARIPTTETSSRVAELLQCSCAPCARRVRSFCARG